jgi:D-alanyl-D-alanine carboxypeptidase/D-alanyl-D-alanine-endopeptidase (penicillin-binding protein 4)
VMGSTGHFRHDWWAPGWRSYFPDEYIPLPSALTFKGNVHRGVHIRNPEHRAAKALTRRLRARGVRVRGRPGKGHPPSDLKERARVASPTLMKLLRRMLRPSSNFMAEVLGKRLAVLRFGTPGTIAKGARAIRTWAHQQGAGLETHDSSGLSYDNRVSPRAISRLLGMAESRPWGRALRAALPGPGEGTLEERLGGVRVRAKTGTRISALSGWVWLQQRQTWAEFSIMSRGMSKDAAVNIEDEVVRILWRGAH